MSSSPRFPVIHATFLYLVVLSLTVWNGLRLWTTIAWRGILSEFISPAWTIYLALSGTFWLVIGLLLLWLLHQRKPQARILLGIAAAGYTLWYWGERLWLHSPQTNWPFVLTLNVIVMAYLFAIILDQQSWKHFQREAYERKSPNQTSA
jgi:hypothetical protein